MGLINSLIKQLITQLCLDRVSRYTLVYHVKYFVPLAVLIVAQLYYLIFAGYLLWQQRRLTTSRLFQILGFFVSVNQPSASLQHSRWPIALMRLLPGVVLRQIAERVKCNKVCYIISLIYILQLPIICPRSFRGTVSAFASQQLQEFTRVQDRSLV